MNGLKKGWFADDDQGEAQRSGQGAANPNRTRDCVPQPDSNQNIDALSNRPMMQLKYRNFGSHESMVFNQTIDVSGSTIWTL